MRLKQSRILASSILISRYLFLAALLFSFLGPWLDHHFVERQPFHNHVYLDGIPRPHRHYYERPHTRSDTSSSSTEAADGILILPGDDGNLVTSGGFWDLLLPTPALVLTMTVLFISFLRASSPSLYPNVSRYLKPPPRLA